MGVNSLPKTVIRQRLGCDSNPGPSAPESSTLTTRLPSHPLVDNNVNIVIVERGRLNLKTFYQHCMLVVVLFCCDFNKYRTVYFCFHVDSYDLRVKLETLKL